VADHLRSKEMIGPADFHDTSALETVFVAFRPARARGNDRLRMRLDEYQPRLDGNQHRQEGEQKKTPHLRYCTYRRRLPGGGVHVPIRRRKERAFLRRFAAA